MNTLAFAVIALGILGFGLVSGRLERTSITLPMVFVAFGLALGASGLGLLELRPQQAAIHTLAELTLILVLFTDASRIDLKLLRRDHGLPVRLLSISLPLTIVAGAVAARVMFPSLTLWEAAALGALLAPTDAALGQAVVTNRAVPVRVRQTLNVESGLNDGIALPFVLVFLSLAGAAEHAAGLGAWARFAALQVVLGPVVGVLVGFGGGRLVSRASAAGWMSHAFQDLAALGLSLLAFALAELVGGNGFIAAFAAGLTLGNSARPICACLFEFGEAEGQLLTLFIFLAFGAAFVPQVLRQATWTTVAYAVLSLTVIRLVPVAVSLLGARLRGATVLFLAWFGPRGIATVLYALLLLERADLAGRDEVLTIAMTTVLLSVFAHGVTAAPGAAWYARRLAVGTGPGAHEHAPVSEMPLRFRA